MEVTEITPVAAMSGEEVSLTGHYSKRVLPGDIETVRAELKVALEKLDYFVESEQSALIARRKNQLSNYAGKLLAGNVLPFVKRLQITLAPKTEKSAVIDFAYSVMNSVVTKGDRRTIESEIDALAALALSQRLQAICPACGTTSTNNSRFCRVCGIANAIRQPAEIEVLRLKANARAAYQKIIGATIFILCWIALFFPLWLLSHQSALAAAIVLGAGTLTGLLWSLSGIAQLHRTLNPPPEEAHETSAHTGYSSQEMTAVQFDLLQERAHHSVMEETTELLNPLLKKEVPIDEIGKTTEL